MAAAAPSAGLDRLRMVPGTDYYVTYTDKGKVDRSENLQANLKRYQLYQALLQGGDAVLWPPQGTLHPISGLPLDGGSYLTRMRAESRVKLAQGVEYDPFFDRVNQSAHVPIAEQIIDIYVNTLFRQQIDRSEVTRALGEPYMANVDLLGHNAEDFLAYVYTLGLAFGWLGVLTDMPRLNLGEIPSKMHEELLGVRPYSRVLSPTRIWQWERDSVTGEFTWAMIHEQPELWRIWTAETWTLIDPDGRVVDSDAHDFGKVPIDIFIAQEPTTNDGFPPIGVSAINSTALMQLQVDQHQSLGDELQRKTNYPFLHVQLDPERIDQTSGDEHSGPGWMLFYEAEVNWKAPPDTCLKQNREHIADLESKIYKAQGVHRRSQDSVEAHSGLALDYESSPIYATVQAWARRLRSFENRFWQTIAGMMGKDLGEDVVKYPDDFSERPIEIEVGQASGVANIYGGFGQCPGPVRSYIDMKVATAMERDKGHIKRTRKLIEELGGVDYDAEPAEEPTGTEPQRDENGDVIPEISDAPADAEAVDASGEKIEEENAVDPATALNGAQVASMVDIIVRVANKELPRETGVAMIVAAFPLDAKQADAVMGEVGRSFFIDKPEPPPQFGQTEQPPEDEEDDA